MTVYSETRAARIMGVSVAVVREFADTSSVSIRVGRNFIQYYSAREVGAMARAYWWEVQNGVRKKAKRARTVAEILEILKGGSDED